MNLSSFGQKFASQSGIVALMDDLGTALNENPNMIFMGGGNPALIPDVEQCFKEKLEQILNTPKQCQSLLGIYQSPQGDKDFRVQLARFFNKHYQWDLSENNIAIGNGSQSTFFILFNLLAGNMPDGSHRSIHLPLSPEYIGYADTGLSEKMFTATKPVIELLPNQLFKYHIDKNKLNSLQNAAALCVSRPSNPTGNVLSNDEINYLDKLAKNLDIPLIIDGAYGLPFPNIVFTDAQPQWNANTLMVLSLSKLGLPGARTGILIGNEEIIQAFTNANTIVSLACSNLGPAIAKTLFDNDDIIQLSQQCIKPFYQQRAQQTLAEFQQALKGLPYRIHKPEGAIFLWLWFEALPISSQVLYQRLKQRGVLIVPGEDFFIGIDNNWPHKYQCIRVSYAQNSDTVSRGIAIIADEVRKAYQE